MVGGTLIAAAVAAGFLGFQLVHTNPNATLVADLPVIVHVDIYSQFQEIQFLRDLRQAFEGMSWKDLEPTDELARLKGQFQTVALEENRREWLRHRTREEKTALRSKYNRCDSLTPEKREDLRELHLELVSANDSDQLLDTMFHYQGWLQDLPPSRKYQLRDMAREQRVHEIVREVQQRGHGASMELTADQYVAVARKIRARMPVVRARTQKDLSQRNKERLAGIEGRKRQTYLLGLRDELRKIMAEILSDQQQSQFQQLSNLEQEALLRGWLQSAWGHGEVTQKELEEYFANELDPAEREKLLALPRDQMQRRLRRLYLGVDQRHWTEVGDDPGRSPGPPGAPPGLPHHSGFGGRHPGGRPRGNPPMHDGPRRGGPRRGEPRRGEPRNDNR